MMETRGDRYDACSRTHQALAGHPAGTHVTKLLGPGALETMRRPRRGDVPAA